jgi:archaellum component FlaF (FlaF/FlaG flagellin family)
MFQRTVLLFTLFIVLQTQAQNNSLLFDGVNDKVVMLNDPIYTLTNGFTIEAWIYANAWKPNVWQGTIIGKDLDPQRGFVLRCGANGTLSFTVGTGSNWNEIISGPVMSTDTWYHVAAVLDGGQSRIYINGSLVGSGSCPASMTANTALLIGESSGFSGRVFDGRIDEVRIWNVVRSESDIAMNQAVDLTNTTSGLVAYYKLDETSGTIASNHIAPGVTDGTLVNFGTSPWQSGYTIPGLDMKTEAILSPDAVTLSGGASQVKARFKNNGLDPVTSFEVSYTFNGGTAVSEQVNVTLAPGESYLHTFNEAVLSNGSTDALVVNVSLMDDSNSLNDAQETSFAPLAGPNTLMIFEAVQHNFSAAGQSHVSHVSLPENNSAYGTILMNIWVDCPTSGCDPWDQPAKISLVKDGITYELARFITPYGKACGPWIIDVTSFKSILQGDCDFLSYIQVWGASGWMLNVSLTYAMETVDHPFQRVTPIYDTDNWVYGDPGNDDDLPNSIQSIHPLAQDAQFRLTVSGHGQANTDNAAEFSPKTHQVSVNGVDFQSHFLWKNDCEFNDCDNQAGTWLYDRAGWCPGQGVDPLMVELGSAITTGEDLILDYQLQAYTNLLNTGYNGGSHTEPHYKIHAYLVEKADEHIASESWINATAMAMDYPTVIGDLSVATDVNITFKNTGTVPFQYVNMKLYVNGEMMLEENVDITATLLPGGQYNYTFTESLNLSDMSQDMNLTLLVHALNDEAANDNVINTHFDLVSGLDENRNMELMIYPNPNQGEVILFSAGSQEAAMLIIYDLAGRTIDQQQIPAGNLSQGHRILFPYASGTYLLELQSGQGNVMKKVVVE